MAITLADRGDKLHYEALYEAHIFLYSDLCNYMSSIHLQEDFRNISP